MALIKCKKCGKEIKGQSKYCVNCGSPIVKNKRKTNNKNIFDILNDKESKTPLIIMMISIFIIMFFLIFTFTFNNILISLIVVIVYGFAVYMTYNKLFNQQERQDKKKASYIMLSVVFIPLFISIILTTTITEWSYNNFLSSYSDMEYYLLELNVFGKCHYYYSNLDKDIDESTNNCSWEKDGRTYTFYLKEDGESNSFECVLTNGKLKCPLQYSYPRNYIYLEKQ